MKNNKVKFTNREGWDIDGASIGREIGIPKVKLINDFVAVGYGILTLNPQKECVTLQEGNVDEEGPIACLGAGTGLGQCYVVPVNNVGTYHSFASEGGHIEYAPRDEIQFGLQTFLKEKFEEPNRISVERIVSGIGLANVRLKN